MVKLVGYFIIFSFTSSLYKIETSQTPRYGLFGDLDFEDSIYRGMGLLNTGTNVIPYV